MDYLDLDYVGRVKKDPNARESRLPAIAIWTVSGLLVGLALGLVISSFPVPAIAGLVLGLGYGLFATRKKFVPEDD